MEGLPYLQVQLDIRCIKPGIFIILDENNNKYRF